MIPPIISVEILESILTVAGSLLVPLVGERFGLKKLLHWPKRDNSNAPIDLLQRLQAASSEMDSVISELRKAAEDRSKKVSELEASIKTLAEKEASLKEQIAGTEGMSIATANTFARIVDEQLQKSERPAKRRDYSLFAAGVVVSALVGIGIEVTKPLWEKAIHLMVEQPPVQANPAKTGNTKK